MKKLLFISVLIFVGSLTVNAQDLEKKTIETKAKKVETTRGEHPYIKVAKVTDDENLLEEPKEEQSRATYCKVWIDNNTGYTIDIYIDGEYMGTIPAWKQEYTWAIAGKTHFYAESVGGSSYWGPYYFDCNYEYTWKLGNS